MRWACRSDLSSGPRGVPLLTFHADTFWELEMRNNKLFVLALFAVALVLALSCGISAETDEAGGCSDSADNDSDGVLDSFDSCPCDWNYQ